MRRDSPRPTGDGRAGSRREAVAKVARYTTGSVVAAGCSEVAFLLLYGAFDATPAVASVVGWLAGAVPNYWLNRSWTWRRRGRPSLRYELVPYVAIVLGTVALATVATTLVHRALEGAGVAGEVRLLGVGGTFLAVYAAVFLLRFYLLDQMFRRAPSAPATVGATSAPEHPVPEPAPARAREPDHEPAETGADGGPRE